MVKAIGHEMVYRVDYLDEPIRTIYFGGGTPTLLPILELEFLLKIIKDCFEVADNAEVTIEANPEDISTAYAKELLDLGFNRLSVGVQTFNDDRLKWMNRIHSAKVSKYAVDEARSAGFQNISLDLIYAIPDLDRKAWQDDLEQIVSLSPEHISLYGLTIENKTVFGKWESEQKLTQVPENEAAIQYLYAIEFLKKHGYQQYEVSNFGKKGFSSQHNQSYWRSVPYLGVGPGAHSFDGTSRQFNIRNNPKYIKAIEMGEVYWEEEQLSKTQLLNEKILTQLRTTEGLKLATINDEIDEPLEVTHKNYLDEMEMQGLIEQNNSSLNLTSRGFLVADDIALKLFFPE